MKLCHSWILSNNFYDKLRLRHLVKCYEMLQVFFKSTHCKIPKISPGLVFFKGAFCRVYFRRTFVRWKSCVTKSIGLAYGWRVIDVLLYCFCFVLFCIWGQFPSISPRGLIFGGAF